MKQFLILIACFLISYTGFSQEDDATAVTNLAKKEYCKASFYSKSFHGRKTASGKIYNENLFTAASNKYKFGTRLKVINRRTGKSVDVVVNDRMHKSMKGRIDLSRAAFKQIADHSQGLVNVEILHM